MAKRTFEVPDISCHHCVMTIERELGALDGVTKVEADVDTKKVTVEWDDRVSWKTIADLLTEINYAPA
ncbi:MAG: heavy metal-associated domain-containing protein [Anaerolineae bacterium]|jgi:copper ion binding protein